MLNTASAVGEAVAVERWKSCVIKSIAYLQRDHGSHAAFLLDYCVNSDPGSADKRKGGCISALVRLGSELNLPGAGELASVHAQLEEKCRKRLRVVDRACVKTGFESL